jgi:hypothetical protein
LASSKGGHGRFGASGYICRNIRKTMAEHHHEGHFPEEAEQNEIGPVVFALMCFAAVILLIWAGC